MFALPVVPDRKHTKNLSEEEQIFVAEVAGNPLIYSFNCQCTVATETHAAAKYVGLRVH